MDLYKKPNPYLRQKKIINATLAVFDALDSQKAIESAFFETKCVHIKGFVGSGLSFRIAAAFQKNQHHLLLILDNVCPTFAPTSTITGVSDLIKCFNTCLVSKFAR